MEQKLNHFFTKNGINEYNIKYIIRENTKSCLFLIDGKTISTYLPAKTIAEALSPSHFLNINKGIFLNKRYIINIDKNTYTSIDNRRFYSRCRLTEEQKQFNYQWKSKINNVGYSNDLLTNTAIFEHCPLGFCIIEIVFNEHGSGVDFLFRYCNKKMESIEELSIDEMVNHSFFDLFPNDGLKWVACYADSAINGTQKVIHEYSPSLDKYLSVYCFQVKERFCGCIVFDSEEMVKDILSNINPVPPTKFNFLSSFTHRKKV